jgi:GNAT superfamily N-acetyltransferase
MTATRSTHRILCPRVCLAIQHIHDPFVPPGDLLAEYTVPSVDLSSKELITYEVYRGRFDNPTMRAYHQRLQFFLLFFIDRSSYINDADLVWEIILLFQKRVCLAKNITTYHIVGYTTLYKFLSYPSNWQAESATYPYKMRLSQILILPPFQRAGHGQKLLQLVYQEAEKRGMIEVNIEDPSPVFQMLRDLTDITMCRKARFFEKQRQCRAAVECAGDRAFACTLLTVFVGLCLISLSAGSDVDPLERWDPVYASVVKAALRITLAQVRRCYEIFRLNAISDRHKNSK